LTQKLESIRKKWEASGRQFPKQGKVTPTSRDPYLGHLEEENILTFLKGNGAVLDLGCGDASHTVEYAKRVARIVGIDIANSLIEIARKRVISAGVNNIDFIIGSVLNIKKLFGADKFDFVISQRCLINLPEWRYQKEVILQVHSLLEADGLFILTEGFQDELDRLNEIREKIGLAEIEVVSYNKNLRRKDFEAFVSKYFNIVEVRHYGAYLFMSRVLHPLVVLPDAPKHDARLNEAAMEISRLVPMPDLEKYSYNLFYVLKKL